MSICTSVSHILPSIPSYLQYDAALKPSNWLGTGEMKENLALVEELEGSLLNVKDKHDAGYDPYFRVPWMHKGKSTVVLGEPCMVNPASESALETVVNHLRDLSIGGGRHWTIVHSDGVPFVQLVQMQDNRYICSDCGAHLDQRKCFD